MSEVIRNDIFHFASKKNVPTGFYRLCKQKPMNPLFFLPNLLVVAEGNNDAIQPCFDFSVISTELYESIEDGDIGIINNGNMGNDSNLLIVFYVQIVPDDFVMQLHRF